MQFLKKIIIKTPWLNANLLTSLRLLSSLPLIFLVWQEKYNIALIIFIIFSLTDLADGYLARLKKNASEKGMLFDAITDMLFFLPLLLILGLKFLNTQLVCWLVGLEILRGLLAFSKKIFFSSTKLSANLLGKIKAWFEALGIIFLLWNNPNFINYSKIFFEIVIVLALTSLIIHFLTFRKQLVK